MSASEHTTQQKSPMKQIRNKTPVFNPCLKPDSTSILALNHVHFNPLSAVCDKAVSWEEAKVLSLWKKIILIC